MSKIKSVMEQKEPLEMIITVGIPASGKSTWALQFQEEQKPLGKYYKIIERDHLRASMFCDNNNINSYKFSKDKEEAVTEEQDNLIRKAYRFNQNVIISDTNLNPKTRARLFDLATEIGYEFKIKVFDTPLHKCIKYNLKRNNTVPDSVMLRMEKKMREYLGKFIYKGDITLPRCIIVDLDGTLADMKGIRGPFEWDKVDLDRPKDDIITVVNSYVQSAKTKLFIFTGRDGSCLELTKKWLDRYKVPYDGIFIRPEGNSENDTIIKEKLFEENILGKYNVDFVLDDRLQVVRMWQSLGLEVLDVGNGVSDF